VSDSMSIDWDARIEEALTEQPHLRRVRCRCKGCQGPPSCRCCVELHLFPMDLPDDIEDDQDDTELSQPDDQSVIHWHDRAVAAEAALAESTARADRLAVENAELRAAFIQHRTATHEVAPKFCKTCRESDAVLNRPADTRGAEILGAARDAVATYDQYPDRADVEDVFDSIRTMARALGVVGEGARWSSR
jgi:hypothetical protein